MKNYLSRIGLAVFVALAVVNAPAQSQTETNYPNKTIRLVVPLAAGGPTDAAARAVAKALAPKLNTEIIVENKPGANGAIGASTVLAAPADGYTLLFAPLSMAGLPATMKKPPFASMTEMSAVGTVQGNVMCVFAHPSLPTANLKSFVDYAKANPGKLTYGYSSLGEYLVIAQLVKAAGLDLVRVPYKGSAQMMPDFLEGRINVAAIPVRAGAAHAKAGKLKAMGCAADKRVSALADTPTLAEGGLRSVPTATGHVITAPPKTSAAILMRLSAAITSAFEGTSLRTEMDQLQLYGEVLGPTPSIALIRDTEKAWQQFVRDAAIERE